MQALHSLLHLSLGCMFLPLHHSLHYASPNVCADGERMRSQNWSGWGKVGAKRTQEAPKQNKTKLKTKQNSQPKMAAKLPNGKPQPQSAHKLLHILHSATYLLRTQRKWNKLTGSSNILGQQTCFGSPAPQRHPILEEWRSEWKHHSPSTHCCSTWLAPFHSVWHSCACYCPLHQWKQFRWSQWELGLVVCPGLRPSLKIQG